MQNKMEGTKVFKMLRKSTKLNTTEDIKYDIGRKTVAEVASHNPLEKEGRKGLGETEVLWSLHQCTEYKKYTNRT